MGADRASVPFDVPRSDNNQLHTAILLTGCCVAETTANSACAAGSGPFGEIDDALPTAAQRGEDKAHAARHAAAEGAVVRVEKQASSTREPPETRAGR